MSTQYVLERTEKSGNRLSMGKRTEGLGNWELEDQSGMLKTDILQFKMLRPMHGEHKD